MILAVLALGGTILGATTIAGLLTVYGLRQSGAAAQSAQAIYAADAGVEWALYRFFVGTTSTPALVFTNGASVQITCDPVDCFDENASSISVRSLGKAGGVARAFELNTGL
jgi:hypothetical protein